MFARFDENPAMTLEDIKETKRYGRMDRQTHRRTHGQRENSIPTTNKVCGGIMIILLTYRGGMVANSHEQHLQKPNDLDLYCSQE